MVSKGSSILHAMAALQYQAQKGLLVGMGNAAAEQLSSSSVIAIQASHDTCSLKKEPAAGCLDSRVKISLANANLIAD